MKNADMAMYLAKEEGKNNFQFYHEPHEAAFDRAARARDESAPRARARRVLAALSGQGRIQVGAITGVEALLRWHNPELGSVSPAQFIPLAEETGLIVPIGKWVLRDGVRAERCVAKARLPPCACR